MSIKFPYKSMLLLTLFAMVFINVDSFANTSGNDQVTDTICNVINLIKSGPGKTVAILVIISSAVMLFLGKLSWGLGIAIAVGMGLMFGAESVVKTISGETSDVCKTGTTKP